MVEAVVDKRIKVFESELAFIQDTRIKAIVIATLLKAQIISGRSQHLQPVNITQLRIMQKVD